jgi:hypothetical protein
MNEINNQNKPRARQAEQQNCIEEDEISLIDLFVVLLRYRRMIVGVTLAAMVLAAAGYFLYPPYQYQKALENQMYEAHLSVDLGPAPRNLNIGYSLDVFFNNPSLLYDALKAAGYETFGYEGVLEIDLKDETQRSRALNIIEKKMVQNRTLDDRALEEDQIVYTVSKSENGLTLMYRSKDKAMSGKFLDSLYALGKTQLASTLKPFAETVVSAYERLLNISDPSEGVKVTLENGKERYDVAKRLLAGEEEVLLQVGSSYVLEPEIRIESFRNSFKIKAVVLVVAAFFLSIFLAFVLNAIEKVKADEEAMKKIREALSRETHSNEALSREAPGKK